MSKNFLRIQISNCNVYHIDWQRAENIIDELAALIVGGTGSCGKKFTYIMLDEYHPKKLIIWNILDAKNRHISLIVEELKEIHPHKIILFGSYVNYASK